MKHHIIKQYPEIRCPRCNKLLARGFLDIGEIELKCYDSRCKAKVILRATSSNLAPRDGLLGDCHATEHTS